MRVTRPGEASPAAVACSSASCGKHAVSGHEVELEVAFSMQEAAEGMPASDAHSGTARGGRRCHVHRLDVLLQEEFECANCRAERGRSCRQWAKGGVEIIAKTRFFSRSGLGLGNSGTADSKSTGFTRATAGKGSNSRLGVRSLWQVAMKSLKPHHVPN